MKGVIPKCMAELVEKRYGEKAWEQILEASGLSKNQRFLANDTVEDATAMKVVEKTCEILGISLAQLADEFGHYWCMEFASRIYAVYFRVAKSSRELILNMDDVHVATTRNIAGSRPPRFDYTWQDEDTLVLHYHSHRKMRLFLLGLVKGVGAYYKEDLEVSPLGEDKVVIRFPPKTATQASE